MITPEKTVEIRHITLAADETADGKVAVLSNLAFTESVVIGGTDRLKDGAKIDIAQKDGLEIAAEPDVTDKPEHKFNGKFHKRDRHS